jgi:hypothetical protein
MCPSSPFATVKAVITSTYQYVEQRHLLIPLNICDLEDGYDPADITYLIGPYLGSLIRNDINYFLNSVLTLPKFDATIDCSIEEEQYYALDRSVQCATYVEIMRVFEKDLRAILMYPDISQLLAHSVINQCIRINSHQVILQLTPMPISDK